MNLPEDIANQALDAAGSELTVGDLNEPTRVAQVTMRAYAQCRRQLLRSAHWDFCRKQAPLTMLADATAATPNVGTTVILPWTYEYSYPTDCLKARFVPWNNYNQTSGSPTGNISIGSQPLMTGLDQAPTNTTGIRPARFLVATDYNYPVQLDVSSQWWETPGVSPTSQTVVCTNVKLAQLVYSADMPYPNMWDPQFRAAMVAYLAAEIALPIAKDKKFGMQMRNQNIAIAKEKIMQARITDGNEGFYSSDISTDWMRVRAGGAGRSNWGWGEGAGPGVLGYGWDACGFGDGSAY